MKETFFQFIRTGLEFGASNQYKIERWIGGGAQAGVWKIFDKFTQRHLALKAVELPYTDESKNTSALLRDRIVQEARRLAVLEDYNYVVGVKDVILHTISDKNN